MIIDAAGPYHGGAPPEKVIDGDLNSIWNPIGLGRYHNNWYITFELDTSYVVTRVQLVNYGDRTHDITSFKLEASSDNINWYMSGNKDGVTVGSSEWQSFDGFAATGKYLRFTITSTYSGWQPYLKEIRFAGYHQAHGPKPTEGSDCNCDYSTFSSSHTMNKYRGPDRSCGAYTKTGVTDNEIKTILNTHNELRENVAKGLETKGSPGPQPSAKNMLELKWNCELAEVAQKWAERCKLGHDRGGNRKICNRDYSVGQNARSSWSSRAASASEWESAIKSWYSEVKDMPKSVVESFDSSLLYDIGHYTQVVWAETYEIGCGGIDFPGSRGGTSKIYVCNYGGAGNWRNRKIYEDGKAASNCPNGASSDYPGLCAPPS